jgi:hypothetical protein
VTKSGRAAVYDAPNAPFRIQEIQRSLAIPPFHSENLKHLAFVIDGPPEVVNLAFNPNEHLVQMPNPSRK